MHIVRDNQKWESMPSYVKVDKNNKYNFDDLSMRQLVDCMFICDAQVKACREGSPLIPLIKKDKDRIIELIELHKKAHNLQ